MVKCLEIKINLINILIQKKKKLNASDFYDNKVLKNDMVAININEYLTASKKTKK